MEQSFSCLETKTKDHDDNEQETSEMQFGECALNLNAVEFASRSKSNRNHKDAFLPIIHGKSLDRY